MAGDKDSKKKKRGEDEGPVDLAARAASLGARVVRASGVDELRAALLDAKRSTYPGPTVIHTPVSPSGARDVRRAAIERCASLARADLGDRGDRGDP